MAIIYNLDDDRALHWNRRAVGSIPTRGPCAAFFAVVPGQILKCIYTVLTWITKPPKHHSNIIFAYATHFSEDADIVGSIVNAARSNFKKAMFFILTIAAFYDYRPIIGAGQISIIYLVDFVYIV